MIRLAFQRLVVLSELLTYSLDDLGPTKSARPNPNQSSLGESTKFAQPSSDYTQTAATQAFWNTHQ